MSRDCRVTVLILGEQWPVPGIVLRLAGMLAEKGYAVTTEG